MKEVVYNDNNLLKSDINEIEIRPRAIIINEKDEILMCYSNGLKHYEFPGGHSEENETINECLKREILEETGLEIDVSNIIPFFSIKYYIKNYDNYGNNKLVEFYYFEIKTEEKYNMKKMSFDENEQSEKYECQYIPLSELYRIIEENKKTTLENNTALDDILLTIKEYLLFRQNKNHN